MLALPPEMVAEIGIEEGTSLRLRSHDGRIEVERADLSSDFLQWVHRNIEQYDEAYRALADQ